VLHANFIRYFVHVKVIDCILRVRVCVSHLGTSSSSNPD